MSPTAYKKWLYMMGLIILYMRMLTPICFVLLVTLTLTDNEPINFDYKNHGADWQCPKNGSKQSPILLSPTQKIQKQKDSHLFGDYTPSPGQSYFLNTTVYINTSDSFGAVYTKLIDGTALPFKATEIRLRMHSEHQLEDGYADLEVQVFHVQLYKTTRNFRLAIGVLFREGEAEDGFVREIIEGYGRNKTMATIQVDLRYLVPTNVIDDFWFYLGSATIPGCSDGKLQWVVLRKIQSVTAKQLSELKKILSQGKAEWDGNWRSLQAQNSNIVGFRHLQPMEATL